MQRCWLLPKQQPQPPRLAAAVKFSLTTSGSDLSVSDESASPPPPLRQPPPQTETAASDALARRPLTTTTCCVAELARSTANGGGRNCQQQRTPPPGAPAQLPPRQQHQKRHSLVYCDNTLAQHRPLTRRTRSFPPTRARDGDPAPASQQLLILLSLAAASTDADLAQLESLDSLGGGHDTCSQQQLPPGPADDADSAASQRRRRVRFADALGFELASVRVIDNPDDPPEVPRRVLAALSGCSRAGAHSNGAHSNGSPAYSTCWRPLFPCRTPQGHLESRLPEQKITLEAIRLETMALEATVLVQNLGPIKQVAMRLTDSAWQRHSDLPLDFLESVPSQGADRFRLRTCLPVTAFASRQLQFALRLTVAGCGEFWDNNGGRNYAFVRLEQPHSLGS